jgi:alpha-tubulin suppressor-like RCC1 family protein
LGNPRVERELLPKPVEALRGVRVGSMTAALWRSYAVADTGEVWAWVLGGGPLLGHGMQASCPLPKLVQPLRGIKVDAVAAGKNHTLAVADDGSMYAWGDSQAARLGTLGLGSEVSDAGKAVRKPQRVPAVHGATASALP